MNPEHGTRNAKHDVRDVVFLHGWGSGAAVWKDLADRLSPRFRVHAPELPGYDGAPACQPYTLRTLARVLADSAPGRCHVVGWSLGGLLALEWSRRAPRQVARLALIATTPSFIERPGWPWAMAAPVFEAFERGLMTDRPATLKRFHGLLVRGDERARAVRASLRERLRTVVAATDVLAGGLAILRTTDLRRHLRTVVQPVLVVHGDRDSLAPLAAGEYLGRRLFNARFLVLRGTAHVPFLSKPEETTAALREFFDE